LQAFAHRESTPATEKEEAMKLRVVPTKAHAAVDHVVGPTLMLAPELFRLKDDRKEALAPRAAGAVQGLYSNLTDYELAAKRLLPVKAHLAMDAVSGALLGAAPWMLGTAKRGVRHWLPHALVGGMEIGLALTTKTEPGDRHAPDHRLNHVWKLAKQPQTWKATGRAAKTVAASPRLRKASRRLSKAV
jgi:hypothetical protein